MDKLAIGGGTSPRLKFVQSRPVPRPVSIAFGALVALAALALVNILIQWWTVAGEFSAMLVLSRLVSLGFLALNVFISFAVLAGRSWARLLLTLLSVVGTVYVVVSIVTFDLLSPLVYADAVLSDAAVVLLWLPSSNVFFRQVRAARAQYRTDQVALRPGKLIR